MIPEEPDEVKSTPISRPDVVVPPGVYHVRAKIMANQSTLVRVGVEGLPEEVTHTILSLIHI